MSKKRVISSKKQQRAGVQWNFPMSGSNFLYFGVALVVIVLGYGLMATGITSDPQKYLDTWANPMAIVVAPTLLIIAYCVIIPIAIMKRGKSETESAS
ncbi:MAG: DUF3098 domain-containing protein [Candidatus Kapaibacterium sp.]|nr:MAG: DUF3098 domain-containing protein [Candidatus Kapabacteria bacterium]